MKKLSVLLIFFPAFFLSGCIINGFIKNENGEGVSDVTMTLTGPISESVATDETGKYQFDDNQNWLPVGTYTVTPSKDGYRFTPSSQTVTITARDYKGTDTAWPVNNVDFESDAVNEDTDPIVMGVAGPHSGDLAYYGIPSLRAAELVAEKFNTSGGIVSRKVEIMAEDDLCDPDNAIIIANKFVSEKVNVVLGHYCSDAAAAALPIYAGNNILSMSPAASDPELTHNGDSPTFFRTIGQVGSHAELAVDFAVKQLQSEKLAILYEKSAYGQAYAGNAQDYLDKYPGVEVVLYGSFGAGDADFSSQIVKMKQLGPACVIFAGHHPEASRLIRQMNDIGVKIDFIGSDRVIDDLFIEAAGEDAEGAFAIGTKIVASNSMYKDATEEHIIKYGSEPGSFFYEAYSGALALLSAMRIANSTDSNEIMQVLRSEIFETPLGSISFDDKGDVVGYGCTVYQVKESLFVEYEY